MNALGMLPIVLALLESLPKIVAIVEQTKKAVEAAPDEKAKLKADLAGVSAVLAILVSDL